MRSLGVSKVPQAVRPELIGGSPLSGAPRFPLQVFVGSSHLPNLPAVRRLAFHCAQHGGMPLTHCVLGVVLGDLFGCFVSSILTHVGDDLFGIAGDCSCVNAHVSVPCSRASFHGFAFAGVFAWPLRVLVRTRLWNGASRTLGNTARLAGCAANCSECGLRRFVFLQWPPLLRSYVFVAHSSGVWNYG